MRVRWRLIIGRARRRLAHEPTNIGWGPRAVKMDGGGGCTTTFEADGMVITALIDHPIVTLTIILAAVILPSRPGTTLPITLVIAAMVPIIISCTTPAR